MDLAALELLRSSSGQKALACAMELTPDETTFLSCFNRLEKMAPSAVARAALEQALLRRRGAAKFRLADRMFFEREALEQASSEAVARHRAARFTGLGPVADLCCGLGGDTVALADGGTVVAVDRDPLRLALARHNAAVYGLEGQVRFVEEDVFHADLAGLRGAFIDPDRRIGGRRQVSITACKPSLWAVRARLPADLPLGAKLAPAVPWTEIIKADAEVEFISLSGELKECVLWFGPIRTTRRRATVLPRGETLAAAEPAPSPPSGAPGTYLYDPDPAVVRAGLVSNLAGPLQARQLDAEIAYLTSDGRVPTPFARRFAVEASLPFHLQRLKGVLRERGIGRVQVMRRGSPVAPEELVRRLKLSGEEARTIVLTRVEGKPWVLVVRADPGHE